MELCSLFRTTEIVTLNDLVGKRPYHVRPRLVNDIATSGLILNQTTQLVVLLYLITSKIFDTI